MINTYILESKRLLCVLLIGPADIKINNSTEVRGHVARMKYKYKMNAVSVAIVNKSK